MKKIVVLLMILVPSLVLSSCIDIFQHLTRDTNSLERNTIRVTVSKTIFAMAKGLSGSDNIDYEKLFDESDLNTMDMNEYNQFGVNIKKINDLMDIGFLLTMNIDYRDRNLVNKINRANINFIPKYNGKNIIIHIDFLNGKYSSSDDNAMAAAFLATGKYRLAVNKKCIADIGKVTIKANNTETEINFLDLYDEYLIEIPLPIIMMSAIDLIIYSK
jgi:hypothetical protein